MKRLLHLIMLMSAWLFTPLQGEAASTIYVKGNITASQDDGDGWQSYKNYDENKMTPISETLFYYHVVPAKCYSTNGNNWFRFDVDGSNLGTSDTTNDTAIDIQYNPYDTGSGEKCFVYHAANDGDCYLILEQAEGAWKLYVSHYAPGDATAVKGSPTEISIFYESLAEADYKIWAWEGDGFNQANAIGTTNWDDRPAMSKVGYTSEGRVLYKYVFGGNAVPQKVTVTHGDSKPLDGDNTTFTNNGYYIENNGTASFSYQVTATENTVPTLAFRSSLTNWNTDVSSDVMTYDDATGTYSFDFTVPTAKINDDFYFKFYIGGIGWLLPLNTTSGSSIRANEAQQGVTGNEDSSWKLIQSQSLYVSYTFTVKRLDNGRYLVTVKGNQGRTEFKKGLYLIGNDYDGANPNSALHYRFKKLPNSDNEYYFDLLGTTFNGITPTDKSFRLALIREDNGNLIKYGQTVTSDSWNYGMFHSDENKTTSRELAVDANGWILNANGNGDNNGMYRLIVKMEDGTPTQWRYESYPDIKPIYKLGDSSDWETNSFLYTTDGTDFWGTGYFGANENFKFLQAGNKWIPNSTLTFTDSAGAYLISATTSGTYTIYYVANSSSSSTPINSLKLVTDGNEIDMSYDSEESCWSTQVDLSANQAFTFKAGSNTWGEDGNAEHWDYNHITSGNNDITYTGPAGTMKVRFFVDNVLHDWNSNDYSYSNSVFYTIEAIDIAPEFTLTPQIAPATDGKNRVFINNALIDVNVTNGSKSQIYFDGGKTTINNNSNTAAENNTIKLSTPGVLNVGDGKTVNETDGTYDFAYSTSDNYVNFWNNHHSSQTVTTGGGLDCITIFVRSAYSDTGIYAWDWGKDALLQEGKTDQEIRDETTQRDTEVKLSNFYPGTYMTEERTLEFNGEKWYYMAFPRKNLNTTSTSSRASEVPCLAVIVNRINPNLTAQEATDYADTRKTPQEMNILNNTFFGYTYDPTVYGESGTFVDGTMAGALGKIEYRLYDPSNTDRASVCNVVDKGVVIAASGVTTANYYNSETGASGTASMQTVAGDSKSHTYAQIPDGYDRVYFTKSDNSRYPADGGAIVLSGGYYFENTTAADKYPTILYINEASTATYNTFLTTETETTIESHSYPNGQDYYKKGNADDDLTMLLDPTWNKKVTTPNDPATDAAISWSGISGDGYAHQKTIAANTELEQTIFGLESDANYTVQAIVYSATAHNNAKLTLTGASTVEETIKFPGINYGHITQYGRVEKLNKKGGEGKIAKGWTKVEATVAARSNGSLTIKLTNPSEYILADVTLLENANTPGHFWTKAPTSNTTTDYDLTAEKKFSFFDRGDNLNAVIYASKNAVITMDPELDPANANVDESEAVNRQAPYNVVLVDGEMATMEHLYLTEANSDGLLDPTFYTGTDADLAAANLGAFYTSGHSFGIKADKTFIVKKATFDRKFNANQYTAVCLPFNITRAQIEDTYGEGSKVYQLAAIDTENGEVTYKTNDQMGVTANVPFLLYAGSANQSLEGLELNGVTISQTPALETTITGGKAIGNYEYLTINTHPNGEATNYTFNPVAEEGRAAGRYAYAKDGCIMKPFRFYLQTDSYIDVNESGAMFSVLFIEEILEEPVVEEPIEEPVVEEPNDGDSETTGIVALDNNETKAPIFNTSGQLVNRDGNHQGLSKGVYIQDGRKFVVK